MNKAAAAEPLPDLPALRRLTANGIAVRRGELVMLVGMPNSGKSAFVLWMVKELNLPTLYFSADNNVHTSLTRLLSSTLQIERNKIVADLDDEEISQVMEAQYMDALKGSPLQFCFDGSISLNDITAELDAYVEIFDEWPQVIIVDNLVNVEGTGDREGQSGILSELHYLSRVTGAAVFILHHASESGPPGRPPDPRKAPTRAAIQNKVSHFPDLILTVAADSITGNFEIAAVKVRGDKSDPTAQSPYMLWADLAKCTFYSENPNRYRDWSPSGFADD